MNNNFETIKLPILYCKLQSKTNKQYGLQYFNQKIIVIIIGGNKVNGRQKCEMINQIRRKVADNNDIDFVIYDCTFEGECSGRCQKSDSELSYLERELEKRQDDGIELNLKGVFTLDVDVKSHPDERLKRQEKMEDLLKNPELEDLPPRYLDMLL